MTKYLLSPMVCVLVSLLSGCTTERHYPAPPPQTVIYEEKSSAGTRSDAREAAREGAREGARDTYR